MLLTYLLAALLPLAFPLLVLGALRCLLEVVLEVL